jgi:hypothetical protein
VNWAGIDFLGWRDPKAPRRGYVVTPWADGIVGITLRAATKPAKSLVKSSMCSMCMTVHAASGVTLFAAPLAGSAGRNGNTIGTYICDNLQCSRYLRGTLKSEALVVPTESLDLDGRIARLHGKLKPFIDRVIGASS